MRAITISFFLFFLTIFIVNGSKYFGDKFKYNKKLYHEEKKEGKALRKLLKHEAKARYIQERMAPYSIFSGDQCPSGFVRIEGRCVPIDY
ncbi:unnamed protein product [Colias eurytheme]|nr:unnamed protein product [Colias eurytheme]